LKTVSAFLCGLIFGTGLILSGMGDPAKVLNFLDVAGTFDPSLIFVMGGAMIVTFLFYRLARSRARPVFAASFQWPSLKTIDWRLVTGAALFGAGWGLSGFCPGPVVLSIPLGAMGTLVFVAMMVIGMAAAKRV
jgi:uncharacterized protein